MESGAAQRVAGVVSIEEYLGAALAEVDSILNQATEARNRLAIRLKALSMASDERVEEAVAEYQRHLDENRGYDDTVSIEELMEAGAQRAR